MSAFDHLADLDPPCPRGCGRTIDDCNEAEDEGDCAGSELVQQLEAKVERLRAECVQFDEDNTGLGRALAEARDELARYTERLDLDAWDRLEAERDRYRQHSITLNSVAFAIAEALGDVPPGADRTEGNPIEQAQRLIAEVNTQRQQQALLVRLIDEVPGTYPSQAHEIADEVRFILDKDGCRYCPPGCRSCTVDGDCECYDHQDAAEPSGEADLDPDTPPTGRTRCPLCKALPIGHEGDCEP